MSTYTQAELDKLFDEYFGMLRGGPILTEAEYDRHKEWSIECGLFEYQISSGILRTKHPKNSCSPERR